MHPNRRNYSELGDTYFPKSTVSKISLSYSLVLAGSLGALGRRFESCRPDSNNPIHRKGSQPFFFIDYILGIIRLSDL